jgi:hypothetical protein
MHAHVGIYASLRICLHFSVAFVAVYFLLVTYINAGIISSWQNFIDMFCHPFGILSQTCGDEKERGEKGRKKFPPLSSHVKGIECRTCFLGFCPLFHLSFPPYSTMAMNCIYPILKDIYIYIFLH